MNRYRKLLGTLLGKRLPVTSGTLRVDGPDSPVTIHRESHGIPLIEAHSDDDAAFAIGFCHGQDRAFQLELLLRVVRGTLAELIGSDVVGIDRLSRRVGFRRHAQACLAASKEHNRRWVESYAAGINAGVAAGLGRRPHELVLLRGRSTTWQPADVVGMTRLMAFLLPANWDQELVRLKVISADGPEALAALDPAYPVEGPAHDTPGAAAGEVLDRLADDLESFAETVGIGGGSNAWALAGSRTASGRPLLVGDPHLRPTVPAHWYLLRVKTPSWGIAGATFVGIPAVLAGHNGHGAWSLTVGLVDSTDLFVEEIRGDTVRRGDAHVPCERREERIEVKGGEPEVIDVLETSHGPVISPEVAGIEHVLAMRATWLDTHPLDVFDLHRAQGFEQFRDAFRQWQGLSVNMVWADDSPAIGWQLTGRVPRRRKGYGTLPCAGWDPEAGWEDELEPFDRLPWVRDPACDYVVSANHLPTAEQQEVFLGRDWLEPYRAQRISTLIERSGDWDPAACRNVLLDVMALPWWELRDVVLAAPVADDDARLGRELLAGWGGKVAPWSAGATVFELLAAELTRRVAETAAPRAARWVLGEGMTPLTPVNFFPKLRYGHLVAMIREDDGPLGRPWPEEIADALSTVVRRLRERFGPDPDHWRWGAVKAWHLPHPLATRAPLDRVFNLGPLPGSGDHTTPSQHGVAIDDPLSAPAVHPSLRLVIDIGDWDASRFALPGGQSGNPASPHYDDQLDAYLDGTGVPLPWSDDAVRWATRTTLSLLPAYAPDPAAS